MHRTPLSLLRIWTLLLLAACGDKEATRVDEGAVAATESSIIVGRTAFPEEFGTYPRLIRLTAHPTAAGALIATFESKGAGGAAIYRSDDDGASWRFITKFSDPTPPRFCCSTLYELPTAMGTLPAGTLLWATSAGVPDTGMSIRVWRSLDVGATWQHFGTVTSARAGLWEPEFEVDALGRLAVYWSSEAYAASGYNQAIAQAFSSDGGKTWTAPQIIVGVADGVKRPGMPVVTKTPTGWYLMTYEICNWDFGCVVHVRPSRDGYQWGDRNWLGYRPTSDLGNVFAHAPAITWVNDGSATGRVLLIGQRTYTRDGKIVPGNGGIIFSSPTGYEDAVWTEINAPVQITETATRLNWCNNYSTALVGTRDGRGIIGIAGGDQGVDGACKAFWGVNSLFTYRQVQPTPVGTGLAQDWDRDGKPDLIAREAATGQLWLYSGNGLGGFSAQRIANATNWNSLDALVGTADVSGDGLPDVWARERATGALWLYTGDGKGGFSSQRVVGQGFQMHDALVAPGDVTGDGLPDLWGRERSTGKLWVYTFDRTGNFVAQWAVGSGWNMHDTLIAAGDANRDGRADLWARNATTKELYFYPGDGRGSLLAPHVVGTQWGNINGYVGVSDQSADGYGDLWARDGRDNTLKLYKGDGKGGISSFVKVGDGWNMHDALF